MTSWVRLSPITSQLAAAREQLRPGTLELACHAAVPVALDAGLLNLLRVNFFLDPPIVLPYEAEAALLLSPLCRELGEGLYEIDPSLRNALLSSLVAGYGHERMTRVAALLEQYTDHTPSWQALPELEHAQRLTALSLLDPERATDWLDRAQTQASLGTSTLDREWFVAMNSRLQEQQQPGDTLDRRLHDALAALRSGQDIAVPAVRELGELALLPGADLTTIAHALAEVVTNDTAVGQIARTVLDTLVQLVPTTSLVATSYPPTRPPGVAFEHRYQQLVADRVGTVELFGLSLGTRYPRYALAVAYVPSRVSLGESRHASRGRVVRPFSDVLAENKRIIVTSPAGYGKSTLIQWIALRCANSEFRRTDPLDELGSLVPFIIHMRHYADRDFPTLDNLLDHIGGSLAAAAPVGWTRRQMQSGRGILLIDGIDELPAPRRGEVRTWLNDLATEFPIARYIVTSRPTADPFNLHDLGFVTAELQPMDRQTSVDFIQRWFATAGTETGKDRAELKQREQRLLHATETVRYLRELTAVPLFCAIVCEVSMDRDIDLAVQRVELCELITSVLLMGRDESRNIRAGKRLTRMEKTLLLRDLAFWLLVNDLHYVSSHEAADRFAATLRSLRHVSIDGTQACNELLERSGLIYERLAGRIAFIYRTFQEYLAATAVVDHSHIELLTDKAHTEQWREVLLMAVGMASTAQRSELLNALLDRADHAVEHRRTLRLLAQACLEISPEVSPEIRARITSATLIEEAALLAERGEVREAELLYRRAAEAGDTEATTYLARLLHELGEVEEADLESGTYVADDAVFPDHAWSEAEMIFTEEDDEHFSDLDVLDNVAAAEADAGVQALIRTAREGEDHLPFEHNANDHLLVYPRRPRGVQFEGANRRGWGPGWPDCQEEKLTTIRLKSGLRLRVRREIADLVRRLLDECERRGYRLKGATTGALNCRPVEDSRPLRPSNHSWGLAVDVNWDRNVTSRTLRADIPPWMVHLMWAYGFYWGGWHNGMKDPMHFEFVKTPVAAIVLTGRLREALALQYDTRTRALRYLASGPATPIPFGDDMFNPYFIQAKGDPRVFIVTSGGVYHVKNPTYMKYLQEGGVPPAIKQISRKDLDELLEVE